MGGASLVLASLGDGEGMGWLVGGVVGGQGCLGGAATKATIVLASPGECRCGGRFARVTGSVCVCVTAWTWMCTCVTP